MFEEGLSNTRDGGRLTREEIEAGRVFIGAAIALVEGMSWQWYERRWDALNAICDIALKSAPPA